MSDRKRNKHSFHRILAKICRFFGAALIILVLALLLVLSAPKLLGYSAFNIVSPSMTPAIRVGSLVLSKPVEGSSLEEGDIIAFTRNGSVVCHRIVANNTLEARIVTKGDANADNDPQNVNYSDLIGKVEHVIPFLGSLGAYVSTVSGKLLFAEIIILASVMVVIADRLNAHYENE